ncbi:MAG TPA: hypothetical protein VL025_10070, partial [Thermoanaerobaculia bacterium]|nr:hypothetical protein [Thermoanaerobaculia bacterium]
QKQDTSGGLTLDVTAAENHTTILSIAPSPLQQGVIWVGTDDGRLHVTRDGGKSWDSVEKNVKGVPANTWIPEIRPSKHDPASAFVVFDNHRRSDWKTYVYRTDDYGKSWRSLVDDKSVREGGKNAVRGYALSIEQDPGNKDLLFLGTEWGLWWSRDAGKSWLKWTHGLPTVSVMDMVIHPREHDLVLGTHGRSVYILDDIRPLREMSDQVAAKPLHLFTIADAQQHQFSPDVGGFALGSTEYRAESRPYGAFINVWLNDPTLPHPVEERERERKEKERAAKREAEAKAPAKATAEHVVPAEERPAPVKEKVAAQEKTGEEAKEETAEAGDEEKKDEKPREIEILIADAQGRHVRKFTAPARQGLNRIVWSFNRNAYKPFPPPPGAEPNPHPGGPEVIPGTYQVTVRFAGREEREEKGTVKVLPDPRTRNTPADWAAREQALERTGVMQDSLATALDRILRTRSDIQAVTALLEKRKKDEKDRAKATALAQGQPEPVVKDEKPDPLTEAAGKLQKGLTDLEKRLWVPQDTPGILPDNDALTKMFYVRGYILS